LATFLNLFSIYDDFKILFSFQNLVTFGTFFQQKFFLWVTLDCFFWSPSGENLPQKKTLILMEAEQTQQINHDAE
jgi:hypothetical protein